MAAHRRRAGRFHPHHLALSQGGQGVRLLQVPACRHPDLPAPASGVHALRSRAFGAADGLAVPDHHDRRLGQRADRRPVRAARNPGGSADPGQPGGGPGLALEPSPRAGGGRSGRGRHADRDRQGAGSEGQGSLDPGAAKAAQGQALPGLELRPAAGRGGPARGDHAGRRQAARGAGDRQPIAPRGRHAAGLDRAPRRASLGDRAPLRRPDHRGRTAGQGRRAVGAEGRSPVHNRPGKRRTRTRPGAHGAAGGRCRVRR